MFPDFVAFVVAVDPDFVAFVVAVDPDFADAGRTDAAAPDRADAAAAPGRADAAAAPGRADAAAAPDRADVEREIEGEPEAAALGLAGVAEAADRENPGEADAADRYLRFYQDLYYQEILPCFEAEVYFVPQFCFHCLPCFFPVDHAGFDTQQEVVQDVCLLDYSFLQ